MSFPGGEKFVVTAYHVVKGAPIVSGFPEIYITLYDGRTWKALFSGRSEDADIAIIAPITLPDRPLLSTDTLPSVELSNSGDVKVGEAVFVMGSPGDDQDSRLGLSETMTTGVISQINRGATINGKYIADLLQFDAAANFGNSGSPLFNNNGEVIGVVIARVNPLLGDGISFAVKSSQITNVWSNFTPGELGGRALTSEEFSPMYKYPWTGLTVRDITPREMFTVENALTAGAKVTGVAGPASDAGVKEGDIITKIDDRIIHDSDEFYSFLAEYYAPGDTILLEIMRGEEELSITLEVQEKP
jgi:S1-C subfamily serine protease